MTEEEDKNEMQETPRGQKFFDNLLWLFIISMLLSLAIYNAWGLVEILSVPTP